MLGYRDCWRARLSACRRGCVRGVYASLCCGDAAGSQSDSHRGRLSEERLTSQELCPCLCEQQFCEQQMALKHLSCSEWTYLVLTLLLLTTSTIGFAMFAAFFPPAMVGLGLHQTYIAPIFSSFTVGNVLCSIASAPLATRFGRRPILFCGVVCVSAGSLVFGLVPDIISGELPMVLFFSAARCVQGGGGGIVNAVALSMLSDQFPKNKGKVLGVASTAGSMAFFVGPPVGGILYELGGFRLPFILSAVLPPVCCEYCHSSGRADAAAAALFASYSFVLACMWLLKRLLHCWWVRHRLRGELLRPSDHPNAQALV